jgi:hypothetical protein
MRERRVRQVADGLKCDGKKERKLLFVSFSEGVCCRRSYEECMVMAVAMTSKIQLVIQE